MLVRGAGARRACGASRARSSPRCGSSRSRYTDLFRGIPTILVISSSASACPPCSSRGLPNERGVLGDRGADARVLGVRGRGLPSGHRVGASEPDGGRPVARACRGWQSMRFVVLPQAVRRVHPAAAERLHRTAEGLGARRVPRGDRGAPPGRQIISAADFDFTPFVSLALVYLVITIPQTRFVDWLDRARPAPAPGAVAVAVSAAAGDRDRGAAQVLRRPPGAARRRPRGGRPRGRLPDRRLGVGQVDAAAMRQPARADRRRAHRRRGRGDHRVRAST